MTPDSVRTESDYQTQLDRLLDEVDGNPFDAERQTWFRAAWTNSLAAHVDVNTELANCHTAYRELRDGQSGALLGVSLSRTLVDRTVLCELDWATGWLMSATERATRRSV